MDNLVNLPKMADDIFSSMDSLEYKVYTAARDNMALTLYALLYHKEQQQVYKVLTHSTTEDGQTVTPLIIAAKNGHFRVVQTLINYFHVDIEQIGTVKFDGYIIEGATALWCCSGAGFFNIVKLLVEKSAQVNHATVTNSTPLRAACFDGRLDIVKYLVGQGADLHMPNKYKNTCLMIACYKGHEEVVRFLLESGANPNDKAHCGASALHFAAERGYLQITKDLVDFKAKFFSNNHRMTALHVAAENGHADIVEFFISLPNITKLDRIEALELLGASYANDKDNYDVLKCYNYLWLAMRERYSEKPALLKDVLPPVEAYDNRTECQTIDDLEAIEENHNAIHLEALIIRERILGLDNPEVPHPIIFRGAVFADSARFDRCIDLWLRALDLQQKNDCSVAKDLMRFAQVFSQMIHLRVEVKFKTVHRIFMHMVAELTKDLLRRYDPSSASEERELAAELLELDIHCSMYILAILVKLDRPKDEEFSLCQDVYRYSKLDLRLQNSRLTPLHMACDEKTIVDDFHINDVVSFPCNSVASLLIKCGADVNAVDKDGHTPLHTIVRYNRPISDFLTLHNIIVKLVNAGTHFDQTNHFGETAMEYSTTGVAEIILRSQRKMSLKCLAARVVRNHKINYQGQIPVTLEEFVSLH